MSAAGHAKLDAMLPELTEIMHSAIRAAVPDEPVKVILILTTKSESGGSYHAIATTCASDEDAMAICKHAFDRDSKELRQEKRYKSGKRQ